MQTKLSATLNLMDARSAIAAAAVFFILLIYAVSYVPSGRDNKVSPTAAAMPSYCGTKATERLPECGWTAEAETQSAKAATTKPQNPSISKEQLNAMAALTRLRGYSCKEPISARHMLSSNIGFVLHCRGDRPNAEYWYDIEDRGGHFIVSVR